MHFRLFVSAFLICIEWAGLCGAAPIPPNLPGNWNLAFSEEFDATLNPNRWQQSLWGLTSFSGEAQAYNPSAVSLNNGLLSLTATRQTLAGQSYVSGLINTGPILGQKPTGFSFRYGYAEARMKLVSGQGLWPAFWMLPDPNPTGTYHDGDGEIDIMEEIGSEPTVDQVHFHQKGSQWGKAFQAGIDLSTDFHDYGVNWQPGKLDFYFDGKLIDSISAAPSVAEYLILNMAVGADGSWPGAPNSTTALPSAMQVDYVRIFQQAVPEPGIACTLLALLLPMRSRRRKG
ncbi:MAG: glycoside hydrolase family 16 [Bryobacterales bacterium]|nr:glycoside hydrolase family 16 [Bryobacterales bacterium]